MKMEAKAATRKRLAAHGISFHVFSCRFILHFPMFYVLVLFAFFMFHVFF